MDDVFVEMHGYGRPGKYGVLSVGDTGEGMDEKITARIFEPFLLPKKSAREQGLGWLLYTELSSNIMDT